MTETLQGRLSGRGGSGIYRLDGRWAARTLARCVEAAGWRFVHLDAGQARDKRGFLSVAAQALQFPDWAGHNWDAFEELVNDLSWLPRAAGYVLLLDHLSTFARRAPEDVRICLDILGTAADRRAPQDPPLLVLVRGAGKAGEDLPGLALEPRPVRANSMEKHDA